MNYRLILFALIAGLFSLVASSAFAQTSMQRRAQQEQESQQDSQDEATWEEEEEQEYRQESQRQPPPSSEPEVYREERSTDGMFQFYRAHKPGLRLDVGIDDTPMWGIGIGYMFAMGWEISALNQEVGVLRGGLGPDATFIVSSEGLHGVAGFMAARLHAISSSYGGIGLEGALGAGLSGGGLAPGFRLGVFFSGRVFEIGYFYQATPLGTPSYMKNHNIGLRVHIPLMQF